MNKDSLHRLEEEFSRQITDYFEYRVQDEEDFRFLHNKADFYLSQFFYPIYPPELLELDPEDRNNFWVSSLNEQLDLDFQIHDSIDFVTLSKNNPSQYGNTRVFMDLRNPLLGVVYYLGNPNNCQKLNKLLMQSEHVFSYSLSSELLLSFSSQLESINEVKVLFEQILSQNESGKILKAHWKGFSAQKTLQIFQEQVPDQLNINMIGGKAPDHLQSTIQADSKGYVYSQYSRLFTYLEIIQKLKEQYLEKIKLLSGKFEFGWKVDEKSNQNVLKGQAVILEFPERFPDPEKLVNHLTTGVKPFFTVGLKERVSRELWSISLIDTKTGQSLDLDITGTTIKVYAWNPQSLPFVINLQNLLQQSVDARIKEQYV